VRFVAFPTARDRAAGTNGRLLNGDVLSAAPSSGKWVYCADEPQGRRYHRVFGRPQYGPKMDLQSSVDDEAK
jgi:hypothetical protein